MVSIRDIILVHSVGVNPFGAKLPSQKFQVPFGKFPGKLIEIPGGIIGEDQKLPLV
jgi:hypothetical protein